MAHQDRRDTRFGFALDISPNKGKSRDNRSNGRDQERVTVPKNVRLRPQNDGTLVRPASDTSPAPRSTANPTRRDPVDMNKIHLPQNQDPWGKFKPLLQILQGCPAMMAHRIPPSEQLYAIRSIDGQDKDIHLRAVQQLGLAPGRGIQLVRETFDWDEKLFILTDYIKPSLSQIITSDVRPTEAHIAFIAYEVSLRHSPFVGCTLILSDTEQSGVARGKGSGSWFPDVDFRSDSVLLYPCPRCVLSWVERTPQADASSRSPSKLLAIRFPIRPLYGHGSAGKPPGTFD